MDHEYDIFMANSRLTMLHGQKQWESMWSQRSDQLLMFLHQGLWRWIHNFAAKWRQL